MGIHYENKNQQVACKLRHHLQAGAHLHSHVEIVYLCEGKTIAWVDDTKYPMSKGDLFITFPNQVHRYDTIDYEEAWLLLIPEELCPEFNPWFKNSVPCSNLLHSGEFDAQRIEQFIPLIREFSQKDLDGIKFIELKGLVLSLISPIFSALTFTEEKMAEVSVIKQMLSFCAANYTEELSLELLEKELHINRFYISHLFSKKLKIKFNDYINSLRVAHACKLLQETDLNMTDIISASGFTTSRTFNRAFLKIMGDTPSKYRKKNRV